MVRVGTKVKVGVVVLRGTQRPPVPVEVAAVQKEKVTVGCQFTSSGGGGGGTSPQNLSVVVANEHAFINFQAPASGTVTSYTATCTGQAPMTISPNGQTWQKAIFDGLICAVDGGINYTVTVVAHFADSTTSPVVTTGPLACGITGDTGVSPLTTFMPSGDRISGVWENATIRDQGTDYQVGTLAVSAQNTFTPGQTIVGKILTGALSTTAGTPLPNIVNCRVRAPAGNGSTLFSLSTATNTAFRFHYCEGDGTSGVAVTDEYGVATTGGQGMTYYKGWTAICCYVHHTVHPYYTSGNTTLKWCSADKHIDRGGDHVDGLFTDSGDQNYQRGNHFALGFDQTGSQIWCAFGVAPQSLTNLTADRNILDGGGYSAYIGAKVGSTSSNFTITNNRWRRSYKLAAPLTIPAVGATPYTVTVTRSTATMPAGKQLRIGVADGTWAVVTYSGVSGSTFTGCQTVSGAGKVATPAVGATNGNLQGAVRVFDPINGVHLSGHWPSGGYWGPISVVSTPGGTYTHTGNVYDDDDSAVTGF